MFAVALLLALVVLSDRRDLRQLERQVRQLERTVAAMRLHEPPPPRISGDRPAVLPGSMDLDWES